MTANRFSDREEGQLLRSIENVMSLVSNGHSPSDAIVKVARDESLSAEMVPLVVQTYNLGRQNYQRTKCAESGTSCLMAEHPIAHLSEVREKLYPAKEAMVKQSSATTEVVCDCYSQAPVRPEYYKQATAELAAEKMAFVMPTLPQDPVLVDRRMRRVKAAAELEVRKLSAIAEHSHNLLLTKISEIREYFNKSASYRLPLAVVESNSRLAYGPDVTPIFDMLSHQLRRKEARATGAVVHNRVPARLDAEPYTLIKAALDQAAICLEDSQIVAEASQKIAAQVGQLDPFFEGPAAQPSPLMSSLASEKRSDTKAGNILGTLGSGVVGGFAGSLQADLNRPTSARVSSMAGELDQPEHQMELKKIRTQAMLSDMMANDPVISGFDPVEVTTAFNELSQMSPTTASRTAVIRPLLRKRLTGELESFDTEQLAKIDQLLRPAPDFRNMQDNQGLQ